MKSLVTYIKEALGVNDGQYVQEMAFACKKVKWGKHFYRVSIHGADTKDRPYPHIHVYDADDPKPGMSFNFEISLIDILCKDEVNLIKQEDYRRSKKIVKKNRNNCSWKGYQDIKDGFEEWLFDKCDRPGEFKDNLDFLIWSYNDETLSIKNALQSYLKEHDLNVLNKFEWYLKNNEETD